MRNYEEGMQVLWDIVTREVVVIFRGSVTMLLSKFDSEEEAINAGEQICRNAGWQARA